MNKVLKETIGMFMFFMGFMIVAAGFIGLVASIILNPFGVLIALPVIFGGIYVVNYFSTTEWL